jgi:hypothetical protein
MADRPNRMRAFTDSLGLEIDRLIKQLPGADPRLEGDEGPAPTTPRPSRAIPVGAAVSAESAESARRMQLLGVWMRTSAAVGLGTAVIYWPYAHDCGWLLHLYMGVVGAVLVTGCWASWNAWRLRAAAAHVIALVVVYWGVVLAAEQVLPRIGYAAIEASWRCSG